MVDRVVGQWHRAVAAGVGHLELQVEHLLLGCLHVVGDPLAVHDDTPAALVQDVGGIEQLRSVGQDPRHPVVGSALLVGGERHDDVALGDEILGLHPQQDRQVHGTLVLVVGDATTEKHSVALDEFERRQGPVLGVGLDHVVVREQEDRLERRVPAPVANDQVALLGLARLDHHDVLGGKAGGAHVARHRLGGGGHVAGALGGVELHQLLEQGPGALLPLGQGALLGLGGAEPGRGHEQAEQGGAEETGHGLGSEGMSWCWRSSNGDA